MKRVFTFFCALCLLVSCFTVMPMKVEALSTVAQLRSKYPHGKYWNHYVSNSSGCVDNLKVRGDESFADSVTSYPCSTHAEAYIGACVGGRDCNFFDGGYQCVGFARKLGYEAYGLKVRSWGQHTNRSAVKPGDVVHLSGGPYIESGVTHAVFVIGVSGSVITVAEANYGSNCYIRWDGQYNLNSYSGVYVYSAPYALGGSSADIESENSKINYANISRDTYYIRNASNNECLSVSGGVDAQGQDVVVWPYNEHIASQIEVIPSGNGYKLRSGCSKTRVINPYGLSVVPGLRVNLWDSVDDGTQVWGFEKVSGGYVIRNMQNQNCVLAVGDDGRNVVTESYTGSKDQIWTLTPKSCKHLSYSSSVTKQPTCTSTGTRTYTCTTCGAKKYETIPATGHIFIGWYVTKAPTCEKDGVQERHCKSCGVTEQKIFEKLDHVYVDGKCYECGKIDPKVNVAKITTQPKNVATTKGKTAKVTIKATGEGLKYQWYYAKKGSSSYKKISGATKSSLSVKMSSSYNGCKVYCVVKDKYGTSVKSNVVTLSMKQPAKITTQPKKTAVYAGSTAKFSIKASGDGLSYTWYYAKKGAKKYTKASDTDSIFELKASSSYNGCKVYCVVKDQYGNTVKSKVVTLTVKNKVKITTQPKSVTAVKNKTAKVTVKATGDGLKYQWYYAKKGSSSYKKLSGATKASYSVKMSSSVNGRKVYCKITDKYGNSVKSAVVTLSMKQTAKITTQPKSVKVAEGKTAKFTLKAAGDGLKYTWYYAENGATEWVESSANTNTISVKAAAKWNGYRFMCVVKDKYGNTVKSKVVTLTVQCKAKITAQPKSVSAENGKTATVTVKATGDGLKYQWYYANKGSSSYKKISGATKASYSVKMTSSVNGRKVYCKITDKYGNSVKSSAATLSMAESKFKEIVGYWNSYEWYGPNGEYEEWSEDFMDIAADGTVTMSYDGMYQEKFRLEYIGKTDFKYYYQIKKDSEIINVTYYVLSDTLEFAYDDGSYMMFER